MAYKGTVMGDHSFLKTVTIAIIKPPMPQAINKPGLIELKVKYPVPINRSRLIAVLFTAPLIVMTSEMSVKLEKEFLFSTGFPDLNDKWFGTGYILKNYKQI